MMKRVIVGALSFLLAIPMMIPITVNAADLTYGQILDDLAKAEKELEENNQSITNTEGEIKNDNAKIKSLQNEIEEMSKEATKLQQEIAEANIEIEEKKEQTKDLIVYLQMSQGENIYLEYVFGGDSITDLVYRLSIVEQITEYNENMVKELEDLIDKNEKRKVELAKKEEDYENKIVALNQEIERLNNSVSKLGELSPNLESEVKSKKELVAYYKAQGCSNRGDVIGRDCAVTTSSNATFSRPITTGYVTSFIGYRWGSLHRGIDIGSPNGRNTPLYSIGNGTVTKIWSDNYGALCINIRYKTTTGQYYTAIYCHLSRYASGVKVGSEVNTNTIVGYMGDTGHAYGVHLHLEVWPCRYGEDSNCSGWNQYVSFVNRKFNEGFRGAESVINFPSKTYQYWYSR